MSRPRNEGARLYQRGRVYWTWYFDINGKRHDVSTKCRDRTAAVIRAKELERLSTHPDSETQNKATVEDICGAYLKSKESLISRDRRSENSREFFETKIGHIRRILGSLRLVELRPGHLDRYVEQREGEPGAGRDNNVSPHTIKKELGALRQALKIAKREGAFPGEIDPLFPTDQTAQYVPRDRALDRDEVTRLIQALEHDPSDPTRSALEDDDRAARVAFLVATAARWSGSERCRREDIAPDLSWVKLRETKTDAAARTVPIVLPDQRALLAYAKERGRGKDGMLFREWGNKGRDLAVACKRAGIARCSPNDLRRTLAVWMRAGGASAEVVGMVLGHTTSKMVERVYARLARRPEMVRSLLQAQLRICSDSAVEPLHSGAFPVAAGATFIAQVIDIQAKSR